MEYTKQLKEISQNLGNFPINNMVVFVFIFMQCNSQLSYTELQTQNRWDSEHSGTFLF
jgi:hypothetical protein